jgi:hypothetical protein
LNAYKLSSLGYAADSMLFAGHKGPISKFYYTADKDEVKMWSADLTIPLKLAIIL